MVYPTIVLAHSLKDRVRFKLSLPLNDPEATGKFLVKYKGIRDFKYNKISKSILVNYDNRRVDLNEIIIRLAISYTKDYDMQPINLFLAKTNRNTSLAYFSIINIALAALSKNFSIFNSREISNFLSWSAVGSTGLAIFDHGYREVSEKGSFDPELVSSVYLLNAVKNGKLLTGSFITWLAAFGRHILDLPYEGMTIKVKEFDNIFTGEPQYNVSIYQGARIIDEDLGGRLNMIRSLINNYINNNELIVKDNYFMGNKATLDSKEVGASELIGDSNKIVVNNRSKSFSI